ncbi:MAG: hypothetical protein ACR2FG_03640 [Marmoricola sp.]
MSRRVFLHVGAPKTGTTYLQDTLATNRELLADAGLSYPATKSGSHFEAAIDLIDHRWGGVLDSARGEWDALVSVALKAPGDAVISHEVLAAATPAQARRAHALLADAEVHLVYTARDLGRQIPAEWQETVKHRGRRRFGWFLNRLIQSPRTASKEWFWRVQGLPDVLTRWGAGLPPDRIHLVTVPQAGAEPGELWDRFAGVLGIDPELAVEKGGGRSNPSMGAVGTTLVRRLNVELRGRAVSQPVYAELVRGLLAHQMLAAREDKVRAELPPSSRAFVEEVTAEWVEWVEGSQIDVVGDLRELESTWSSEPWSDPDRPRPGQVADAAVAALAELVAAESERRRDEPTFGLRVRHRRFGW